MFKKTLVFSILFTFLLSISLPNSTVGAEKSRNQLFEEFFINEEGENVKTITSIKNNIVKVSVFIEGELEQESIANANTGNVSGFSDYGKNKFNKEISDIVDFESSESLTNDDFVITPFGTGFYSQVASKQSVASSMCSKVVTAYLYEKSNTLYDQKIALNLTKGEVISAVTSAIILAAFLKTPITVSTTVEMLASIGASISGGVLVVAFSGAYQGHKNINDYYASINNTTYFTNKITREYFTFYNTKTGAKTVKFIGQQVSAYGAPTSYQVMLSQAIATWAKTCK